MQKHTILLLILLFIVTASHARAETLDDDTIHKAYDQIKASMYDPEKLKRIIQLRYDDKFVLESNVQRTVEGKVPEKFTQKWTKEQVIDNTAKTMSHMNINKYDAKILGIRYSADKQLAYVNDVIVSTGSVVVPNQGDQKNVLMFDTLETCLHTLTLVQDQVKFIQSTCDDDVSLKK